MHKMSEGVQRIRIQRTWATHISTKAHQSATAAAHTHTHTHLWATAKPTCPNLH